MNSQETFNETYRNVNSTNVDHLDNINENGSKNDKKFELNDIKSLIANCNNTNHSSSLNRSKHMIQNYFQNQNNMQYFQAQQQQQQQHHQQGQNLTLNNSNITNGHYQNGFQLPHMHNNQFNFNTPNNSNANIGNNNYQSSLVNFDHNNQFQRSNSKSAELNSSVSQLNEFIPLMSKCSYFN